MILGALSRSGGEVGAAARELQVSRTTMWRLMKKHRIEH
jgi:transcriptional regulator of acetoin/glycerol metabolism